ncbi:CDP-diacylglycerol--serine O-phosphatidyltransferase [Paenibacillus macerans]|uniref:CDP-diacylglycerol--serine O-phosphatidyltransferase n=1 Tax=Paenibacillus macerans TaxID=44252 RepID=A0A6N8F1K6_PAEMA|nr:CDP-diacylglycerol--serine O-phosphatidyltransferase [Paenibacillus macerans]MBS5911058.1 CDP-diacylglycerol--serine O-phosphatidyltransferase [Paenibacillus macerans]MEC0141285.1 CDP-diacylglycerol--serine O-phosphatidyltransferase [Paenibacillus macerans]MEC0328923.1 CDP-diacylglycerol--serine O-phosphatidyltransferase [Paenibacillus macerans]MED4954183.1 CDP-diacylglycerol--serine O-phosphatidyltransferase [Paenibacillus macerans]MUG25815.1 CDP-diacylglycerol--serine O-phosphatidyltransf
MFTKSIPNMFTLGNMLLGMLAIIMALEGRYSLAAIMVIVAMLLDGLDGRVARALNAQSEFGKELDSLSDIISFGVAPALIMYLVSFPELQPGLAWVVTALFPMCGALRLARFNVQKGAPGYFVGLPIPAAGGVAATLSLFNKDISAVYCAAAMVLLSYLMVSTVRYPNFKKIGLPKKAVVYTPIVVIAAVVLAVAFPDQLSKLIFIPLLLYAAYGLRQNIGRVLRRKRRDENETEELYRPKR